MMLKLTIFLSIVISSSSVKLSEELDEARAEMCGAPNKPEKPSSNAPDDQVPWSMGLLYPDFVTSSILISPRHVLGPSWAVINSTNHKNPWKWIDGSKVNMENCKDLEMKLPKKVLRTLKVPISECRDPNLCGTRIERSVVDGYYLGTCESGEYPVGMVLLEMSSNVPKNEPYFVPACIPAEETPAKPNDIVHYDSMRLEGKANERFITTTGASIIKCDANGKFVHSICAKRDTCPRKFMGGSLVKKIDDRETVVGVLYSGECKEDDHFVSVGYFKDKLCTLAGICKTTIPVSTSPAVGIRFVLFTTLLIFLL